MKYFIRSTCKFTNVLNREIVVDDWNNSSEMLDEENTFYKAASYRRSLPLGGKVYQCRFCPYSTKYKSNIQTHLNVHAGKKPFKCPRCGKGFSHKSNTKRHIIICGAELVS